jgi:dihydrofolate reductase
MRKIVAGLFVSLDGVVEAPEKWQFPYFNDEMGQALGSAMAASDTLLLGRRTYQEFAAFWPKQSGNVPFAEQLNAMPKVVVSSTLRSAEWQPATLINGEAARAVAALKRQSGRNILVNGSATLVRWLLRENLLDELSLLVCPVVVGEGWRLFEGWSDRLPLQVADSTTFSTGVLSVTYRPAV